ncbi:MAG: haloacid dehalogenase type II [Pseudomonadota bacterium]
MPIATCVFDAYGTLFDVSAAARRLAHRNERPGFAEAWPQLAEVWRTKQLQYTWLRATAGVHGDFWQVTKDALDHAIEAVDAGVTEAEREALLELYFKLDAYPEVPSVLAALRDQGFETAILSNGSMPMLEAAVESAGIDGLLDEVLSVESVGVFKPARAVYDMVGHRFGRTPREVMFASSNGWDACAASGYGFRTVWVNRAGAPPERLPWRPAKEASDLRALPEMAPSW